MNSGQADTTGAQQVYIDSANLLGFSGVCYRRTLDPGAQARSAALDDSAQLDRARDALIWLAEIGSMAPAAPSEIAAPYILVLDHAHTPDDPAGTDHFREAMVDALTEHFGTPVVLLRAHNGVSAQIDIDARIQQLDVDTNPWEVFAGATALYTVASDLGVAAIFAGHRPRVYGRPWYGGLGLTDDTDPSVATVRTLTRAQLAATALLDGVAWIDPESNAEVQIERVLADAEARFRSAHEDAPGYVASNILLWKRRFMRQYFGAHGIRYSDRPQTISAEKSAGKRHIRWGRKGDADLHLEDGFLRSRGLGAALVRPMSLVLDDKGLYFDPTRPSRLEDLISARADLPPYARRRIQSVLRDLNRLRITKYNLGGELPDLPEGRRILVAGQVEDDASLEFGAGHIRTNTALIEATLDANPDAVIVYKPHPDVEAGLRKGRVQLSDDRIITAAQSDPLALIDACDEVWTMTSLLGFEALIRGKPVTCTGTPFYAGWGLTTDLGDVPARRVLRPSVEALAHAALIDYPRYFDPQTGSPIAIETAIERLSAAPQGRGRIGLKLLKTARQLRARALGLNQ